MTERTLTSRSRRLGVLYYVGKNHILKLHLGHHESGQIVNAKSMREDIGGCYIYSDFNNRLISFQANPSYTYAERIKKLSFPIEIGIYINRLNNKGSIIIGYPKTFTFDKWLTAGFGLEINHHINLGINAVFMRALANYTIAAEYGVEYLPQTIGGETKIAYRRPTHHT